MTARIDNAIYDRLHTEWWGDDSFMALLRTAINPARFGYFREALVQRLGRAPQGLAVLDVGCGGGLLSERFAQLGCQVTGLDRSPTPLMAAREHARATGLAIDYRQGDAQALPFADASFDVVCCCDVLEHVDDVGRVVAEIARVLKPGGVFFFDTINRTWLSHLLAIKLAQDWAPTRFIPRDVHVWHQFIRPQELRDHFVRHGLVAPEFKGLAPTGNPLKALAAFVRLRLGRINFAQFGDAVVLGPSRQLGVSYMGFARKGT